MVMSSAALKASMISPEIVLLSVKVAYALVKYQALMFRPFGSIKEKIRGSTLVFLRLYL